MELAASVAAASRARIISLRKILSGVEYFATAHGMSLF
jgi:hypothetical protein